LYNAPRAATITAMSHGELYALDRNTFNHIVKNATVNRREKYDEFLKTVEILNSVNDEERVKVADALKPIHFNDNEYVVKEVIFLISGRKRRFFFYY
jgi:cAMP-dependent protein kinase regulator